MHTGYPIRIWDVPYAYGPRYTYGAEHGCMNVTTQLELCLHEQKQIRSMNAFKLAFSAKACYKVVVRSMKNPEAIGFLSNHYY